MGNKIRKKTGKNKHTKGMITKAIRVDAAIYPRVCEAADIYMAGNKTAMATALIRLGLEHYPVHAENLMRQHHARVRGEGVTPDPGACDLEPDALGQIDVT